MNTESHKWADIFSKLLGHQGSLWDCAAVQDEWSRKKWRTMKKKLFSDGKFLFGMQFVLFCLKLHDCVCNNNNLTFKACLKWKKG